mgnify:CR=1 FL=1
MEFKVLSDEEHLKIRPSMYIGSVDEANINSYFINDTIEYKSINIIPGLLKIINEIIDNSVDENIRTNGKFANKIYVNINNTIDGLEVSVKDNGRGIPVIKPNGSDDYQPVLAWTKARSGTSFEKDRVTLGANGVGSFATYVFSESFIGETHDSKKSLVFNKITKEVTVKDSTKNFTEVTFQPDISLFNNGVFDFKNHFEYLKQRLINLSVCYPDISFYFNTEKINVDIKELTSKFYKEGLIYQSKNNNYSIIVGSTAPDNEFRFHAYTNGLHNPYGGSIVDYVSNEIASALQPLITKKHKITVTNSQIKNNLLLAIYVTKFSNLKFDSQTKEKITNSKQEVQNYFNENNINFEKIAKDIINTPNIIDPIITAILYKKELAERLELARQQKKTKKLEIVNHIQATYSDPEERLLFLTEGLSAIGPLLNVRQSTKIGGYPLRGKILNVDGMSFLDIMKNEIISELMSIIGLELGKTPTNLNYGKIVLMTDADVDGISIRGLLFKFFNLWGDELYKQNRIFIIKTPLLMAKKNNDTKLFYTFDEFNKESKSLKGYEITYFKGLGTMPVDVYDECINNPKLIPITFNNNEDQVSLDMAFGDDPNLRKKWLLNN